MFETKTTTEFPAYKAFIKVRYDAWVSVDSIIGVNRQNKEMRVWTSDSNYFVVGKEYEDSVIRLMDGMLRSV